MNSNVIGYYQKNESFFAVVLKDFWEKNQGLDDQSSEEEFVPEGFYAVAEAVYEHTFDTDEEAEQVLNAAGFVAKNLFED